MRRASIRVLKLAGILAALPVIGIAALRFVDPPTTSFMLQRRVADPPCAALEHTWTDADRLPAHVLWSALAAEDQRFFEHHGFDYGSIQSAVIDRLEGEPLRGASTISQQVAKNLWLWSGRSFFRKALEAYLTVWLELLWSKPRILDVYLNVAQFGPCTFGIEAASQRYFEKPATELLARESARMMTVLPRPQTRRPNPLSPGLEKRADAIRRDAGVLARRYAAALRDAPGDRKR